MDAPSDFSLVWTWDNGTVPPRFRTAGRVTIDASGRVVRERWRGYDEADRTRSTGTVEVGPLVDRLTAAGLFEHDWAEREQPTVGGSGASLRVTAGGRTVHVPRQPLESQREARDAVMAVVQRATKRGLRSLRDVVVQLFRGPGPDGVP